MNKKLILERIARLRSEENLTFPGGIFSYIRETEYLVRVKRVEPGQDLEWYLDHKKGSCFPKHSILGLAFEQEGIQIQYVNYSFLWQDLKVDYPAKLKTLAGHAGTTEHPAIKAFIAGKYRLIDATWDSPLERAGFHINRNLLNCQNAVEPIAESGPMTFDEYIFSLVSNRKPSTVKSEFYHELNAWFSTLRG